MTRGLFITFEGGDGSGKSTQIECLRSALEEQGYHVLVTREPGGTRISEQIRRILLDKENKEMDPSAEMLLYAAARAQLVAEVIAPAVEQGSIVICDRFLDSSIAYQGYGRDLGDDVETVNRYAVRGHMPDLTIYLRVEPGVGRGRISGREQDRIEQESGEFHEKVFRGYEALKDRFPDRICCIDAGGTIGDIAAEIQAEVQKKIDEVSAGQ